MPLNNASAPETIARSAMVAEAYTLEKWEYLLTLLPNPAGFVERHRRLEANYPAALKGDPEKVKEFEEDRKAINSDLSLLLGLAKVVAAKDPTIPETLGLRRLTEKAAAPVTQAVPHGFKVVFDPKGHIIASVARVPGAKGYEVWVCDSDTSIDANWRLAASSFTCKRIVLTGVNPKNFNVLKSRAMSGNGAGPWSKWVSLDPS